MDYHCKTSQRNNVTKKENHGISRSTQRQTDLQKWQLYT